LDDFELTDIDAPTVAELCRKLDGIALAIEFAAGRVDVFGVRGLAASLAKDLRLLTTGTRTAPPRHQTLRAMLDWSYEWLPEPEQMILRRLSIFAGDFTLAAANAIVANPGPTTPSIANGIANLVTKSLVTADVGGPEPLYRLLETTRGYALEKLTGNDEFDLVARRHAEYYRDICERAETECETAPTAEWSAGYGREIDNVRAALDWALSKNGDASIGIALTAASVPLWFQLSLMEEGRRRVERALSSIAPDSKVTRCDLQLYAGLGSALVYTKGPIPENAAAWTAALEIADKLDDAEYQLRALWGLWAYRIVGGDFQIARELAERFSAIAETRAVASDLLIADRITGYALHFLGDQNQARWHIERMLGRYFVPTRRSDAIYYLINPRATALAHLAQISWLQGFPDQAIRHAQSSELEARSLDHVTSLCYVLADAGCPIALAVGDLGTAEHQVATLLELSAKHGLAIWNAWARCFKGNLLLKRGDPDTGLPLLRTALDELRQTRNALRYPSFLAALAEGLGNAGQVSQGLVSIDEALDRCERNHEHWCMAELLRLKGELVLLDDSSEATLAAEKYLLESLDWARRQGALSWEIRGATSLARLWRGQGRNSEAKELLEPTYERFTEGFETADLKSASALLHDLRQV
jgi:predicted ATPase